MNTIEMNTVEVADVTIDTRHWIGGQRVDSPMMFENISPIDESTLGHVCRGDADTARQAVSAAAGAFPSWASTPPMERARILHAIADEVEARSDELAMVETTDNGGLIRAHRRGVMPRVAHNFRFFADFLIKSLGHPDFETRGHTNKVSWSPAGPCLLITPWNAPLMLATWKIAPALAAGNTVILKPAEWTPLTASIFADITKAAGLPDGVFNMVQGIGEEVGAALVADERVARISFTGSVPTARHIAARAGRNLTPVSLELGGKSPFIVFGDADLDIAVQQGVGQFDNAGQVCLSGTRHLIHESVYDAYVERLIEAINALQQGDPRDMSTDLGPNISRQHVERIDGFVQRAKADGCRALVGGGPNTDLGGLYYRPTLFADCPEGSEILTSEVFGPVVTVQKFSNDDEAIALANNTEFGLSATVITGDRERAERMSREIAFGTMWVNCFFVRDLAAPFGGAKKSGIGREGGAWSFDFYCDVKNTCYAPVGWNE